MATDKSVAVYVYKEESQFIPFLIQNYWNNNTENLSIREVHRKF